MAARIVKCPGCQTPISFPDSGAAGQFKCPSCGQLFQLKSPTPAAPQPGQGQATRPGETQPTRPAPRPAPTQPPASASFAAPARVPVSRPANQVGARPTQTVPSPPLAPFLKKLAVVIGGLLGILLLTAVIGFFSEPAALAATIGAVVSGIVIIGVGRILIVVAAWKESTAQGLICLFVPIYSYVYVATRKGESLRGLAVIASSLAPILLSGLLLMIFLPMYNAPGGRVAARAADRAERQEEFLPFVLEQEEKVDPNSPVMRTTFQLLSQRNADRLAPVGGQAVSTCKHFVQGSIVVDKEAGTVSFEHRGGGSLPMQYRLLIMMASDTLIGSKIESVPAE